MCAHQMNKVLLVGGGVVTFAGALSVGFLVAKPKKQNVESMPNAAQRVVTYDALAEGRIESALSSI